MGDSLSSPGGFLGGFLLAGIFLPITISFLADGAVLYFRGRGLVRLLSATVLTIAIIGLYSVAWQNTMYSGDVVAMTQTIGLILWFSIPAAALGFGVRMLALFLNPTSKAQDQEAIEKRKARHSARTSARTSARGLAHEVGHA
jgi:hypothetical protein